MEMYVYQVTSQLVGTLKVTGATTITGATGVLGSMRVSGATSLEGTLKVLGGAAAAVCATAINGVTSVSLNFATAQNFYNNSYCSTYIS